MSPWILACGIYFKEAGLYTSLGVLLLAKPLAYCAFISAFRYRVNDWRPMTGKRVVALAALRAALGLVLVGAGAAAFALLDAQVTVAAWAFLYGERVFSWWLVGRYGALVRARRLAGWIICGTLLNVAFDAAVVAGPLVGPWGPLVIVGTTAMLIGGLMAVGRRESLRARFPMPGRCGACGYDLTANVSGRCPECGTTRHTARPTVAQAA